MGTCLEGDEHSGGDASLKRTCSARPRCDPRRYLDCTFAGEELSSAGGARAKLGHGLTAQILFLLVTAPRPWGRCVGARAGQRALGLLRLRSVPARCSCQDRAWRAMQPEHLGGAWLAGACALHLLGAVLLLKSPPSWSTWPCGSSGLGRLPCAALGMVPVQLPFLLARSADDSSSLKINCSIFNCGLNNCFIFI